MYTAKYSHKDIHKCQRTNELHHFAPHYTILHHTAPHCTTLKRGYLHVFTRKRLIDIPLHTLLHTATRGNTPQRTATHCYTLQRTATGVNAQHADRNPASRGAPAEAAHTAIRK